ncbi:MAG TPA: Ig-like domain repeat protein [Candidatus Angelobacter sp.]|nr:Ig-like domain repeat protein [Candidatus Angelobacter sp.]
MLTNVARPVFASFAFMIAALLVPAAAQTLPMESPVPSRIVSVVDDSARVAIPGSTHPLAKAAYDIGRLEATVALPRMILVVGPGPDQEQQLRTFLDSQQTRGSADYHRWLTPEEFGQKFGPSAQDIQQVTAWLQEKGFAIGGVAKGGRWIEFSGTSEQVEAAFGTQMRQYLIAGEVHVANATDISIPAALSPVVRGVLSLHNFFSKPALVRSPLKATATHNRGAPGITFGDGTHGIVPGDFAKIYDLNPLYNATPTNLNGAGQTIAIVAASNINTIATTGIDDVAIFRNLFGLPVNPPNIILNGPDPGVDTQFGVGAEATLDTEWSGAVAPNATIDVVVSGGSLTTDPIELGASFIVDENLAPIMNVSFGNCEQALGTGGNSFWDAVWEQAAAQGISAFVSSGDTGAAGCDPNAPSSTPAAGGATVSGFASTPFNTAVGGTEFNETVGGGSATTFWNATNGSGLASAIGYIPEKVWNESCSPSQAGSICAQIGQFLFFSGGGGLSTLYATPSWQTLNVTGLSALTQFTLPNSPLHPRGLPDISLSAAALNDPYVFCFSVPGTPDCQTVGNATTFNNLAGGTSFSSPAFAGIMAIVDQKMATIQPTTAGRQGLANYVLYPLATQEAFSNCNSSNRIDPTKGSACVFNDTTVANNGVPGNDVTNDPASGALGFPTTTGYDLASGLGSVDATNLVNAWAKAVGSFPGSTTTLAASFKGTPLPANVTITHGQALLISASVARNAGTGTPTGSVSLIAQGGNLSSGAGITFASLVGGSGGTATAGPVIVNNLPGGTNYNLLANFPGDGVFAGSTSNPIQVTVGAESSTTTLKSLILSANGLAFGNTVAYGDTQHILAVDADTSGVSGLLPASGNVTFTFGGNAPQAISIDNSGIAEFLDCIFPSTTCLPPGQYTVNANYAGDGLSYNPSTATSITVTVTKGNPTVSLTAPTNVGAGQSTTLTAAIGTGLGTIVATGTVQFLDGATPLGGPATLSGGQASVQVMLTSGGPHSITAAYSGDIIYNSATSAASIVTVGSPFNFTSAISSQTIAAGGTATYNVTLNGVGGFAGQVSFTCTGAPGGATCAVSPSPATLSSTITSVPLTVTVSNTANARLSPHPFKGLPFIFAGVLAAAMAGLRRRPRQRLFLFLAVFLVAGLSSCGGGGGGGGGGQRGPTNAILTVTGTSGTSTNTIMLNLTITH